MKTAQERLLDVEPAQAAENLARWIAERGEPAFRARQILDYLYRQRIADPAAMQSLPRALREPLAGGPLAAPLVEECVQVSRDGTRKYRFALADGRRIESVWIPKGERGTLCISSQAGCPAKCTFCATGAGGFFRNLTGAEILAQWLWVAGRLRAEQAGELTQIVFMGMGEPLLNYAAVAQVLQSLTDPDGFRFSPRRITVSTVGIPETMGKLISDFPQVRLALSLHSAVEETRSKIVPMNRRHSLASLERMLGAIAGRARRVSLEYVVLRGVNDSKAEARALARFAQATAGHINLLPFHPFPGAPHEGLTRAEMLRFQAEVRRDYPGAVTVRESRGLDIAGACGQLANMGAESAS